MMRGSEEKLLIEELAWVKDRIEMFIYNFGKKWKDYGR
jgi:hypothetical protein